MKLKYHFTVMDVEGQPVAIPVGAGASENPCMLRLNDTAADIVRCLEEDTTVDAIVAKLASLYDADTDTLRGAVEKFVAQLRESELLV